jgi:hypothetical protein
MILLNSSALVCALNAWSGFDRLKLLLLKALNSIIKFLGDCQGEISDFRREHGEVAMRAFL